MRLIIKIKIYKHGSKVKYNKKYFPDILSVVAALQDYFNEITEEDIEE